MQEQEKEALRAEIYSQIMKDLEEQETTAELFYQVMKNHEKQGKTKKYKIILGVFLSLWAIIFAPFILFVVENIYTSQKWPVIIRIPTFQLNSVWFSLFELIVGVCIIIIFLRMVWRLINPFRCQCGYITWSAHNMLVHIEMRHAERENEKNEWVLWRIRIPYPLLCQCGYFTWSEDNMLTRVEMKHSHR